MSRDFGSSAPTDSGRGFGGGPRTTNNARERGFSVAGDRAEPRQTPAKLEKAVEVEKRDERVSAVAKAIDKNPDRDRTVTFKDIEQAREFKVLGDQRHKYQSPGTREKYESLAERLGKLEKTPEQHATNKNSFDSYRAAIVSEATRQIGPALTLRDKAVKSHNPELKARAESRIADALVVLRAYPPGEKDHRENFGRQSKFTGPREAGMGRQDAAAELKAGWQERIFDAAKAEDKGAIAVLAVTGARPTELNKIPRGPNEDKLIQKDPGVRVKALENGWLELTRGGAKLGENRGKPEIVTRLDAKEVAADKQAGYLYDKAKEAQGQGKELVVREENPKALAKRIERVAEKTGDKEMSTYDYRHAFANRARNEERPLSELKEELGQRSQKSTQAYGRAGGTDR